MFTIATAALAMAGAQAPVPRVSANAPQPRSEKLICKREQVIGSLIPGKKKCYTKAEWDRLAEAAAEGTHRLIDDGRGRPSGN